MVERLTEVCACLSVEYLPEAVGPAIPATDGFPFSESVWRPRWRCRACEVEFVKATVVDELRAEFSALQAKWLKADDVAQEADARQQIEKIRDAVTRTGRKDKTPWAIVDDVIAILDAAEPALSGGGESLTAERDRLRGEVAMLLAESDAAAFAANNVRADLARVTAEREEHSAADYILKSMTEILDTGEEVRPFTEIHYRANKHLNPNHEFVTTMGIPHNTCVVCGAVEAAHA